MTTFTKEQLIEQARKNIEVLERAVTRLPGNSEIARIHLRLAEITLAALGTDTRENPVLAYADSYRSMAMQGVESIPILSVITDLERNIAPLYTYTPAPLVPETLPCPVHLEPGLKFGKGVRTRCMLDALRRRAEYYAELEAMTPDQRAEHDAGIAEFKEMLGNDSRATMLNGSDE